MSVIFFGRRCYGRVDAVPGAHISTTFIYFQFLPTIFDTSYVFVARPELDEPIALPIPLHWRSVAAGFLRAWAPVFAVLSAITFEKSAVVSIVGMGVSIGAATWAWALAPRVSERERLMRNIYSRWLGCPVDPAALGPTALAASGRLRHWIAEQGEPFAPARYRGQTSPVGAYRGIALDPRMEDRAFLAAAITLCRIEEASAPRAERTGLAAARSEIYEKLAALHPVSVQEPPTVDVLWDHPLVLAAQQPPPPPMPPQPPTPEELARRKRFERLVGGGVVAAAAFLLAVVGYFAWQGR